MKCLKVDRESQKQCTLNISVIKTLVALGVSICVEVEGQKRNHQLTFQLLKISSHNYKASTKF